MLHRWTGVAAVASLAVSLLLVPQSTSAYSVQREDHEIGVDWDSPRLSVGEWEAAGGSVSQGRRVYRRNYILSRTRSTAFARLRIRRAKDANLALLFRARIAGRAPLRIEAYGAHVNLHDGSLAFMRWDPAGPRAPSAIVKEPALKAATDVELLVWMGGSNFAATVLDGVTKSTLAHLTWSDPSYDSGFLGLYAYKASAKNVELSLSTSTTPDGDGQPPWLAPQWVSYVTPKDAARIPTNLSEFYTPRKVGERVALITDERGTVVLEELGIEPLESHPGVPFALRHEDHGGLRDWQDIYSALRELHAQNPSLTRLETLGHSAEGRPLLALHIGATQEEPSTPALLLCASHHANEASTPEFVLDAARYLLEHQNTPRVKRWLDNMNVVAVPMVNPDGNDAFWHLDDQFGRKNRRVAHPGKINRGIDLNRNYPFRWGGRTTAFNNDEPTGNFYWGPAPASEPEVQAMISLAKRHRFPSTISYHAAASRLLVPYTIPGVRDPEPSAAWSVAAEIIPKIRTGGKKTYEAVRALYPVSGTEQDWYYHSFGTLAYLLEIPFRRARNERLTSSIEGAREAWMHLMDRWLDGPALTVRATDPSGAPVEAVVRIDEIDTRAAEEWTTGPHTGVLHHYLPHPGTYTVRLTWEGVEKSQRVSVQKGIATADFVFGGPIAGTETESSDAPGHE